MAEAEFQRENSVTETDAAGRSVVQDPAQTAQAGLGADEKKDMLEVLKGDLSRLEGKVDELDKKVITNDKKIDTLVGLVEARK